MSFEDFRSYLQTEYVSLQTGRALQKRPAGDYLSRLKRLSDLLDFDIEHSTPDDLSRIEVTMGTTLSVAGVNPKVQADIGVALRAYNEFIRRAAVDGEARGGLAETSAATRVYIANFGRGNVLWPQCLANNTIATHDDDVVHGFWRARDRDGYVEAAMKYLKTALGAPPSKPTAGRWYNLLEELQETDGDTWITRQGDVLWWTVSLAGDLSETRQVLPNTGGGVHWVVEKACYPWSDRDLQGRPLRWSNLHPKARDFLSTEATFQTLSNYSGYADYALGLVGGHALDAWHATPLYRERLAEAASAGGRIFSSKELAAERMTRTLFDTVAKSNGQVVERRAKEKVTTLSRPEWEQLLRLKMGEQQDRCMLTGLPLGYDKDCADSELLVSLDRIDSEGHYTPDNVQLVCRFMNRWKGADDDALTRRLLALLQERPQPDSGNSR